jgi:hypothetical protein
MQPERLRYITVKFASPMKSKVYGTIGEGGWGLSHHVLLKQVIIRLVLIRRRRRRRRNYIIPATSG